MRGEKDCLLHKVNPLVRIPRTGLGEHFFQTNSEHRSPPSATGLVHTLDSAVTRRGWVSIG